MEMKMNKSGGFVLLIIIFGLALWIVGSNIPEEFKILNIALGSTLSNLGFMFSILLASQWFYDTYTKSEITKEILRIATNSKNIADSGIYDFIRDSKKVEYSSYFDSADTIIFCSHYSTRYIEDFYDDLKHSSAKNIIFVNLKSDAESINFLNIMRGEILTHIDAQLEKIDKYIEKLKRDCPEKNIETIKFDSILRYSFVKIDDRIWIKFYKNYSEIENIPAICIHKGCLYDFFDRDINKFVEYWRKDGECSRR